MRRSPKSHSTQRKLHGSLLAILTAAGAAGMLSTPGCSSDDAPAASAGCMSTRDYFAEQVWGPVMQKVCLQCHLIGGQGAEGSQFVLYPSSYPDFLDVNLDLIKQKIAPKSFNGQPALIAKPTGLADHGGGKQIEAGSAQYNALKELVSRLNAPEGCGDHSATLPQDVVLEDYQHTFRRAAILLGGRMPTAAEVALIKNKDDEKGFDAAMTGLLKEQAFLDWVKLSYNDVLLTDEYLQYGGRALDTVSDDLYPGIKPYRYNGAEADNRGPVNRAMAQEPLELIAHVVKTEQPFTKIVNADYTVVNPYLAKAYSVDGQVGFNSDPSDDATEFVEARITMTQDTGPVLVPHAGILSTPMFLNRWPTTPTNRSRGRARVVLKTLLATDILKVAERPVDAASKSKKDNPTRNDSACNVCHDILDPIAGGFRGWDENDYEYWTLHDAQEGWHTEMKLPGYGDEEMDSSQYPTSLRWLGDHIADDPRFAISTVNTVYRALTGHEVLVYPANAAAEDFAGSLAAWQAQDAYFRAVADKFIKSGFNFKLVVTELVKSPYFRAIDAPQSLAAGNGAVNALGTGHMLGPELLDRKLKATLGYNWIQFYNFDKPEGPPKWFNDDGMKILYGGIDSDSVIARVGIPNSVMSNIGLRLANEVSCLAVPYDLNKAQKDRILFTEIADVTDVSEANVRKNIVYLFERLLGETKTADDADVTAVYNLFTSARDDGTISGLAQNQLDYPCRLDPTTGAEYDDAFKKDAGYVIRSWMAVVTFLIADYRFLYD